MSIHFLDRQFEILCHGRDSTGRSVLRHPAEVSVEMSGRKPGRQFYIKPLNCTYLDISSRGVLLCDASGTLVECACNFHYPAQAKTSAGQTDSQNGWSTPDELKEPIEQMIEQLMTP